MDLAFAPLQQFFFGKNIQRIMRFLYPQNIPNNVSPDVKSTSSLFVAAFHPQTHVKSEIGR